MVKDLASLSLETVDMGVGAWAWGDRMMWDYGRSYQLEDLRAAFDASMRLGIRLIDTAEVYGQGQSEQILGAFLADLEAKPLVASKFMPFPWRVSKGSLEKALRGSLYRLRLDALDLYQIHSPIPPVPATTWMDAMSEVYQKGLIRSIGVSNYDLRLMMVAHERLHKAGLRLASNQVEYHLLQRRVEKNGLLARCQELGIRLIAYSPLAMGALTGKYNSTNPPQGGRGFRYTRRYMAQVEPLIELLRQIGNAHGDKTPAQVALNWVICKGALPIPGEKNQAQAEANAGGRGWRLSDEEVARLDDCSERVTSA